MQKHCGNTEVPQQGHGRRIDHLLQHQLQISQCHLTVRMWHMWAPIHE
jgi:hypothetical protein